MSVDSRIAFINTDDVVFPDNASVNASGPGATDGTEFVKVMIDNYMFGIIQAMLDRAGLTPDGVVESATASQFIDSLQLGVAMPAGTITEFAAAADPAVSGHRAILLQGQGILRANFPDLDAAVYVGDGNNAAVAAGGGAFYRSDDEPGATPNIVGIYLQLPESRGVVPRGLDTAATIDPDGASRFLGDLQIDAMQGHIHQGSLGAASTFVTLGPNIVGFQAGGAAVFATTSILTGPIDDGVNGTPRTDSETRAYNRSTNFVIWY